MLAALKPIVSASELLINVSWVQPDNSYGDAALHAWQSAAPFLNGNGVGSDHPYGFTASITSAALVNGAGLRSPIGTTLNPAAMQVDLTGVTSFTASALGGGGLPRPSFGTLSASVVQVDLTVVTPFTASVIGSDRVARILSDPLGTRSPALNDCIGRVICDPTGSALVNSIGSRLDNPYGDQFGVNAAMFATRSPSINGDGLLRPYSEVLRPQSRTEAYPRRSTAAKSNSKADGQTQQKSAQTPLPRRDRARRSATSTSRTSPAALGGQAADHHQPLKRSGITPRPAALA